MYSLENKQCCAGDQTFSVLAEIERGAVLRLSVYQHYALVRRVYNLFEDDDVVGITNYFDFGVTVESSLAEPVTPGQELSSLAAVVAWQVCASDLVFRVYF